MNGARVGVLVVVLGLLAPGCTLFQGPTTQDLPFGASQRLGVGTVELLDEGDAVPLADWKAPGIHETVELPDGGFLAAGDSRVFSVRDETVTVRADLSVLPVREGVPFVSVQDLDLLEDGTILAMLRPSEHVVVIDDDGFRRVELAEQPAPSSGSELRVDGDDVYTVWQDYLVRIDLGDLLDGDGLPERERLIELPTAFRVDDKDCHWRRGTEILVEPLRLVSQTCGVVDVETGDRTDFDPPCDSDEEKDSFYLGQALELEGEVVTTSCAPYASTGPVDLPEALTDITSDVDFPFDPDWSVDAATGDLYVIARELTLHHIGL